ncbi:MAG: hypothetical protein IPH84_00045 [Bacteroidales bacterium]|nr:hypothetical protein [Bacteroidales bacterium]
MKKIVFLIAMITAAYVSNAQTQPSSSSETYRNIYKVSASMFTRNTFQMGFEHFFTPTTSLLINVGMNFKDSDNERFWGFGAEAQLKFNVYTQINPKNSHRLYFAPYIMNNYEEVERTYWNNMGYDEWKTDSFDAVGTGVVFGWSYSFANRINLDIYTGGGIRKAFDAENEYYNGIWDYSYSGIAPRLGIDVGFWF